MNVDKQLIEKYNVPVPRYTSYPPANYFKNTEDDADFVQMLDASNAADPQNLAFYIHIPFCQQICFYCGCNAFKMSNEQSVDRYIKDVLTEIDMMAAHIDKGRKISQIHYGGGTPNAIDASYLKTINEKLASYFAFIEKPEIAIECNPALLSDQYMQQLFDAGFNRFSFGIQDFDEEVLKGVNRRPSAIPHKELMDIVRKGNPDYSVNLDFIYGLPGQTTESFSRSMVQALMLRPERLVTFSYAHVPWKIEHQKILDRRGLPGPEQKMDMFLAAYNLLRENGYSSIGLDHYSLPNDELAIAQNNKQLHRNFQGYSTRRTTGQVYAVGVSSISQLSGGYAQNTKDMFKYHSLVNKGIFPVEKYYALSKEQFVIRDVITGIMCNNYLNWNEKAELFGESPETIKQMVNFSPEVMEGFGKDNLIEFNEGEIKVNESGALFIRNIAASLDPAYKQASGVFSKSV